MRRLLLTAVLVLVPALASRAQSPFACAGLESAAPLPPGAAAKIQAFNQPSRGQVHALVLFAGFPEEVERNRRIPAFADQLFDGEKEGSLTHFYDLMSSGQFKLSGSVAPRRYAADGGLE